MRLGHWEFKCSLCFDDILWYTTLCHRCKDNKCADGIILTPCNIFSPRELYLIFSINPLYGRTLRSTCSNFWHTLKFCLTILIVIYDSNLVIECLGISVICHALPVFDHTLRFFFYIFLKWVIRFFAHLVKIIPVIIKSKEIIATHGSPLTRRKVEFLWPKVWHVERHNNVLIFIFATVIDSLRNWKAHKDCGTKTA